MKRTALILFVGGSLLLTPILSLALPRPPGTETKSTETLIEQITVLASTQNTVSTKVLKHNIRYRFQVEGTWKPTTSSNNFADMACETTNNRDWFQSGRGLRIGAISFGDQRNPRTCSPNHVYPDIYFVGNELSLTMQIMDTNYTDGNSGALTVKIYEQPSSVTYEFPLPPEPAPQPSVGPVRVDQTIPGMAITPGTVPGVTVSAVPVPGVPIPKVATLTPYPEPGLWCLKLTGPQDQTIFSACSLSPGIPMPTQAPITVGGPGTGVPGTTVGPIPVASATPLPVISTSPTRIQKEAFEGARVRLTVSWTADISKLFKTAISDRDINSDETTNVWAPFHREHAEWYLQQIQLGNLALRINASIVRGDGTIVPLNPVVVPGLGQVVEAMFMSKMLNT